MRHEHLPVRLKHRQGGQPASSGELPPASLPHPLSGSTRNAQLQVSVVEGRSPAAPAPAATKLPWCHVAEAWKPCATAASKAGCANMPFTTAGSRPPPGDGINTVPSRRVRCGLPKRAPHRRVSEEVAVVRTHHLSADAGEWPLTCRVLYGIYEGEALAVTGESDAEVPAFKDCTCTG